jgi:hypothetical protein
MNFDNQNGAGAPDTRATAAGSLLGSWQLEVKTPFGTHPATLSLRREPDGTPDGDIQSQLGNTPLNEITLGDASLEAVVTAHLQGREFSANLSARVDSPGRISGTIKVNFLGAPALKFTGTKA